jgi:hypothetical protein
MLNLRDTKKNMEVYKQNKLWAMGCIDNWTELAQEWILLASSRDNGQPCSSTTGLD